MKAQAKEYYDQYKDLKKSFIKERLQLNEEKKLIQEYENKLSKEKEKIDQLLDEDLREKVYLKNKVGIQNSLYIDQDIDEMVEILNTLKFENNIFLGLSEKESTILKFVLNKYKFNKNEENLVQMFKNTYKNEEEENLITKIEETVNELLVENKISDIKIKQVTDTQFQFNNYTTNLIWDNGQLKLKEICEVTNKNSNDDINLEKLIKKKDNKEEFVILEDWLISNFPYSAPKFVDRNVSRLNSIQKSILNKTELLGKKTNILKSKISGEI